MKISLKKKISKLGYGYGIYSIELKRLVYTSLDEYEKYQLHKKKLQRYS